MKQNLKQTARERFAAMTLFLLICLPFSLVQAQTVKVNGRVTLRKVLPTVVLPTLMVTIL